MARGVVFGGLNGGGSNIKSIQHGVADMTSLAQIDIPIESVDLTKAVPLVSYYKGSYPSDSCIRAEIIDSTTLRLTRGRASGSSVGPVSYSVVEFNNVKSLQKGQKVCASAKVEESVTVESIVPTKSLLYVCWSSSFTSSTSDYRITGRITGSTTLAFITNSTTTTAQYYLIEFN